MPASCNPARCLAAGLLACSLAGVPVARAEGAEHAQASEPVLFVGLQPSVTVEPYYPDGVFDLNAAPVCVEWRAAASISLRAAPLLTFRFGVPDGPSLAHLGFELGAPIHLAAQQAAEPPSGPWVGPGTALTRNVLDRHWTTGLHLDAGWALRPSSRLALLFSLQAGGTLFVPDEGGLELKEHLGFKAAVGWWF